MSYHTNTMIINAFMTRSKASDMQVFVGTGVRVLQIYDEKNKII